MSPSSGRFLSVDPATGRITLPLTLHSYLYGTAGPSVHTDPSGASSLAELFAAIGQWLTLAAQRIVKHVRGEPNQMIFYVENYVGWDDGLLWDFPGTEYSGDLEEVKRDTLKHNYRVVSALDKAALQRHVRMHRYNVVVAHNDLIWGISSAYEGEIGQQPGPVRTSTRVPHATVMNWAASSKHTYIATCWGSFNYGTSSKNQYSGYPPSEPSETVWGTNFHKLIRWAKNILITRGRLF
jgi:hypothetical protein